MKVIETKVYEFEELSDKAKEKAREWYRDGGFDYEWWDTSYDDFYTIAGMLGLDIKPCGRNDRHAGIQFSGFSSQGDGASFFGRFDSDKIDVEALKEHAPQDEDLHGIAENLEACKSSGRITARITSSGNYCHAYSMDFEVDFPDLEGDEDWPRAAENRLIDTLRDFANWIYHTLEQDWEYLNSDEVVDETIIANEYTFTAEGKRFG